MEPTYAPGRQERMARLLQSGGEYATGVQPPAPFDESSRTGVASPIASPARWLDEFASWASGKKSGTSKAAPVKAQKKKKATPPPVFLEDGSSPSGVDYLAGTALPEVPYEEPTIDVDQLEPMGGVQEISTEATAPSPVQGQPPAYNPRIAELAGNQATQATSAAQFDAQNPAAAMRYAGQQPLLDYYRELAQRPQQRGKWGTFVRDVVTGMPEGVFGTRDSFGNQFGNALVGGVKNSYANREADQAGVDKAGLGYAGAASDQAIYDAIMKRGQEAGQFYNPQEAGELERLQMQQKAEMDRWEMEAKRLRDEELSGYRRNTDERAEERQDYWRDTRGQMTPNAQFAKEKWEASQRNGQSGSYKPPAVGMIDRYLGAKDSMRKLPPTVPEEVDTNGWLPFGKKTVQKPNPEYQAAKEALDYLMLIDPSLNPQGQQAQRVQQQGQLTEQDMQELEMYAQSMVANGKARNVQEAMQMIQAEAGR